MIRKLVKKLRLKDALIIKFQVNGCMAHVHDFVWVGRAQTFEMTKHAGEGVVVQILKKDNRDIRDHDLGTEIVVVENSQLQYISAGLFYYYE